MRLEDRQNQTEWFRKINLQPCFQENPTYCVNYISKTTYPCAGECFSANVNFIN